MTTNEPRKYCSPYLVEDESNPLALVDGIRYTLERYQLTTYAYRINHRQFEKLFTSQNLSTDKFIDYVVRTNLGHTFKPRIIKYSADEDCGPEIAFEEHGRMYQFTKLYHFLTDEFDGWRVPFAVGKLGDFFNVHPGTFRRVAMNFLPPDTECIVLVSDVYDNAYCFQVLDNLEYLDKFCLNTASDAELIEKLNLSEYRHANVQIEKPCGFMLMEFHPRLQTYQREYTVEFDGISLFVNNTKVAWYDSSVDRFCVPEQQLSLSGNHDS